MAKKYSYKDILASQDMSGHVEKSKVKKFFRVAIPIFVIEIIAIIVLVTYLLTLPKNYCKISINVDNAVVYVDGKESKEFRFNDPKKQTEYYYYEVDLKVKLPDDDKYAVTFTLSCDKYKVYAATSASVKNGVYSLEINGGEKSQILTAITITANEKIKDFDVYINIKATKI